MATVQINARIDSELKKALEEYCRSRGVVMNHFIQEAILDRLEQLEDAEDVERARNEKTRPLSEVLKELRSAGGRMATLNIKNLSDRLYRKLRARAKRQHRSVAQEVTHILEHAVAGPEELSIMDLKGLGKEHWRGIEPTEYVDEERDSWE
jgi:plasmid stability protein